MEPLGVTMASSPAEKVALFRALFHGREDVYAKRWENEKSGKSGYSPVCDAEWVRGVCDKKRVACAVCPNRRLTSVDDSVVTAHLRGKDARGRPFTMGVYPLLADDTVRFAVLDFDKKSWRADSWSVCEIVRELGLPIARERSRSGNGAHLWFFFLDPQPARFVREVLTFILSLAMERNPEIGLDSFDRIFPNQDRLPKGGFGNLIALPLQGGPRRVGNTCFVDERLVPYADPWKFLSEIQLVSSEKLNQLRSRAICEHRALLPQTEDEVERLQPWSLFVPQETETKSSSDLSISGHYLLPEGALSEKVQVALGNAVYLRQSELTPSLRGKLIRLASFVNPKYAEMQRMRLNVYATPRVIDCSVNGDEWLVLPRGCLDGILATLRSEGAAWELTDRRQLGSRLDVVFHGELRLEQKEAGRELLKNDMGVLAAGTAFGKTVLAAWIIAERKTSTLVLVNRKELQAQWIERLAQFLAIDKKEIGRIGGGVQKANGRLDVAVIQSLNRLEGAFLINAVKGYGQIVVDECHAVSAPSFEKVLKAASAKYLLGLSATVVRKDGHHPIIEMQCGPVRYRVNAKKMGNFSAFRHVVRVRPTPFVPNAGELGNEGRAVFADIVQEAMLNDARNEQIVADVLESVAEGRSPVVLSERREHLETLERMLTGKVRHLVLMRGGMGRKEMKAAHAALEAVPQDESRVLLATGSYLGEGFDDARLDTLFLTLPISWKGRLIQYAGRLHRLCDGKKEVRIYDYVDMRVQMFRTMFNRRCAGYRSIGYEITMPDDRLTGWPEEARLPVVLRENETYADSIRRLARDGVSGEVADLFIYAALQRMASKGNATQNGVKSIGVAVPEGVTPGDPRSATELFLFRYLETLPQAQGAFVLNGRLPIPFGPNAYMEIDLLCTRQRIALEIDGDFHFQSRENYRRDRRKDLLLQKAGYLVLRFLAEDVVEKADAVLGTILGVLEAGRVG